MDKIVKLLEISIIASPKFLTQKTEWEYSQCFPFLLSLYNGSQTSVCCFLCVLIDIYFVYLHHG